MKVFTKELLIKELTVIHERGWIRNLRNSNNVGSVGNFLEDLLGITENNLPIPNAAEWELKAQKKSGSSLLTLCHSEPSPRALRAVPQLLLPHYGWTHTDAGKRYSENERSFRQTIHAANYSDRGFKVIVDYLERKIYIEFDPTKVGIRHHENWLNILVSNKIGRFSTEQVPYWGFDDLGSIMRQKLTNCFYIEAETKSVEKVPYVKYSSGFMLKNFNFENFLKLLESGHAYVDFDARTGHNHGTKFRMKKQYLIDVYQERIQLF